MDLSLHHPQEDEFVWYAGPSPYLTIAFEPLPQYEEYLDLGQGIRNLETDPVPVRSANALAV